MDTNILNDGLPQNKKWLNPSVYDLKCHSIQTETTINTNEIDTTELITDTILLNQNVAVAVPPNDYSLLYADINNRINVASQAQPTQQIAYLSDIPITPAPFQDDNIISADDSAEVKCSDGGIIQGNINNIPVMDFNPNILKLSQGQSSLQLPTISDGMSQATTAYFGCSDIVNTSAFATTPEALIMSKNNILRMYLENETLFKNANDKECIRIYDYGTQIKGEGQPLATGLRCALNLDGDIFFNREDPIFGLLEIFLCQGVNTRIWSPSTASEVEIENNFIKLKRNTIEKLMIDDTGTKISSAYYLPTADGVASQVMTTNGSGQLFFSTLPTPQISGLYSQTSIKTISNTTTETSLIGSGIGSLTVPPLYFQDGYSFLYKTGGLFRDSANGQTIRFRLRNSGVLFDSGILILSNVNTLRGWNIETQFTYYGGNMISNFQFSYTNANNDTFGFTNQGTNAINNLVSNTLDFTAQWGSASVNNTISSNYGTLTKIF